MNAFTQISPADQGFIAVALDDALALGYGDDETTDEVRDCLISNGWDHATATTLAYRAVHG